MIAAQAFSFVVAGYESISSALSFFFYNLAKNPDVQDKVRAEVVKSTADNPDDVYDAIAGMKYMEAAINESLRLYPPAGGIIRVCREDAVLECGGRAMLECGHQVIVPIQGIHRDPNHFPHPLLFDPDRFKERTPRPGTFCPFGDGQRICIGQLNPILYRRCRRFKNYFTSTKQGATRVRFPKRSVLVESQSGL
ncbi:hypothetical protein AAG570_004999 [Ranatra chinensis]|uniref:Cytochrome P450 n=1 Tax=Ranatra chinensis TaxID=642074 RepID=A0ABD0XZ62_9HEMI